MNITQLYIVEPQMSEHTSTLHVMLPFQSSTVHHLAPNFWTSSENGISARKSDTTWVSDFIEKYKK